MPLILRERIETLEDYLIDQSTEIVEAISVAHPELVFDFANIKAGTETVVIECSLHGNKFALRIRPKGLEKELAAYQDLEGIDGVPKIHSHFHHGGKLVGILVDFIDGPTVPEFLETASWAQIVELILEVRSIVCRVHQRNRLLPQDWTRAGNIRLDKRNKPHLVDLGDYKHTSEAPDREEIRKNLERICLLPAPSGDFRRTPQAKTAYNVLRLLKGLL